MPDHLRIEEEELKRTSQHISVHKRQSYTTPQGRRGRTKEGIPAYFIAQEAKLHKLLLYLKVKEKL